MASRTVFSFAVLVVLLAGCAAPATETIVTSATFEMPTNTIEVPTYTARPPTETALPPTATDLPPTETPAPTSTSLPENVMFRDDFSGPLLDGWFWENENQNRWSFDDGWLVIIAEDPFLPMQSNTLWRDLPAGDFAIIIHVDAATTSNFQQAAIFIYEDENNHVTINRGFCGPCNEGGNGIYMDYKIGGAWGDYNTPTNQNDVYLMLESKNKQIAGYYAFEVDQWERLGTVGDYFEFTRVGIGASNCDDGKHEDDLLARYDYFEIRLP